ncbi:MAG: hypothetical protein QXM12_03165 [Nitrososphaerota archaeon]
MKPVYVVKVNKYKGKYGMMYLPREVLDKILGNADYVELRPNLKKKVIVIRPLKSEYTS